ncbi:hypothetical protein EVAR_52574_1 [Eumeta japonica]|uniref:Uncharacterized protein n=1 Tax=Eumeta variegata TaxID=151549 RepID=A0A4C1YFC8_EUMVA|nr:hypothetical protein EVAR_52574_1 [Eumeta japonica]
MHRRAECSGTTPPDCEDKWHERSTTLLPQWRAAGFDGALCGTETDVKRKGPFQPSDTLTGRPAKNVSFQ